MKVALVIALALLAVGLPLLLGACAAVPTELRGTWRASGPIGEAKEGEPAMMWLQEVTLDGRRYELRGYPPLVATARIDRVERDGRTYRVALTEHMFHGSPAKDEVLVIDLAEDGASFELGGHVYGRQE